jgi:YD repeat-containing protein
MKKITLIILFVNISLFGQLNNSHEEYMKRVLNSTQKPNDWKFSDYSKEGNVDVSTGRFGITIPFTNIENQYLSIPISLSYSTSGVKVDENASEIGMGWDLIAGGQISRKVNGREDDLEVYNAEGNLFIESKPSSGGPVSVDWKSNLFPLSNKGLSKGSALLSDGYEYNPLYTLGAVAVNEYYSKYFPLPRKKYGVNSTTITDNPMLSIADMLNNRERFDCERDVFHVSVGDLNFHFILKVKDEFLNPINLIATKGVIPRIEIPWNPDREYYEAVALNDNEIKIDIIRGEGAFFSRWPHLPATERLIKSWSKNFFKGFIVTDKRGIKYYFTNYVFTEPQFLVTVTDHGNTSPDYHRTIQALMQNVHVNNWVLSRIVFPNNDIIEYDYLKSRITEPKIVPRTHDGEYTGYPYNLFPQITPDSYSFTNLEYEKLYVQTIRSNNQTVQFNYDVSLRLDLQNGRRLKNIQLFDTNNSLIKQFDLISNYKGSASSNDYLSKRLFLDKLIEKSIIDRRNVQFDESKDVEYTFDYYNPNTLPRKNAIGFQDLYGYFLGNTIENAYPPFPKLYINPNDEGNKISYYPSPNSIIFNGAERRPNSNSVYYGAIKNIRFPTKGYLNIEYEPNDFYYNNSYQENNLNGPGCKVKNLKYYSQENTLIKFKRYNYTLFENSGASSGIIMYKPSYAYIGNYGIDNSKNLGIEQTRQYPNDFDLLWGTYYNYTTTKEVLNLNGISDLAILYRKLIKTSTHPIGPMSDTFGREIIYTNVLEEDVAVNNSNTINGKIKYFNYYVDNRPEVNVISGPTDEFTYQPPCSKWVVTKSVPVSDESTWSGYTSPWRDYYGNELKITYGFVEKKGKDIFPFPERNYFSNNNALKIGKTYKIEYYNNLNVKVLEKNYDYSLLSNSTYKTLNFNIDYTDTYQYVVNTGTRAPMSAYNKGGLYFYTIDSLYTNQKMVLKSQETIQYTNNGTIKERVDNEYNRFFLLGETKTTSSNNSVINNKFYYPHNTIGGSSLMTNLQKLINVNRVSELIKEETFVDGINTKSLLKTFKEFPVSIYNQWPINFTINSLLPSEIHINKGTATIDETQTTDLKVNYSKYDDNDNLLEYSIFNSGLTNVILWGYNKTLPIAKIENIQYSQIQPGIITALQNASNSDSEIDLINQQNNLRSTLSNLNNIRITTYTHKPLIGISTITDPKGDKVTYSYDSFGRLQTVKDKEGNVLSENQYNYRPN